MKDRFLQIRHHTLYLCRDLHPEDTVVQPSVFASPPKWHLGHTTWFFETFVLKRFAEHYRSFDETFDYLFNSYYESLGDRLDRNHRGFLFRPLLQQVLEYRAYVDSEVASLLEQNTDPDVFAVVELGLQHEQQHQELLITDTKYLFSQHPFFPAWKKDGSGGINSVDEKIAWRKVSAGVYPIGYDGSGFCFDNELGVHQQYIHDFEIMNRPVTNKEYLEFIEAGGYEDFRYWLSEGWQWVKDNGIKYPMYWHKKEDGWYFFHLDGLQPMVKNAPAMHLSYFEAEAFARWKGYSLPTEFEWETAAKKFPVDFSNNVWEWTQSAYLPYPGFKIAAGAVGEYNGKFMVSQIVLKGGSLATPEGHTRPTYRNFFHPQMQWQFSGVRLIQRTVSKN